MEAKQTVLAKEAVSSCALPDGSLHDSGWYLDWSKGSQQATLDGDFTLEELEAIAAWMREHK